MKSSVDLEIYMECPFYGQRKLQLELLFLSYKTETKRVRVDILSSIRFPEILESHASSWLRGT